MRLTDLDELLAELEEWNADLQADSISTERQLGVTDAIVIACQMPTVDAVPVEMIEGRIKGLKAMLINIDEDEVDDIWNLRAEIQTLEELLEMWAERKEE